MDGGSDVGGVGGGCGSACETGSHPDAVSGSGIIQPGHINTEAVSQLGSVWMHHDHPVGPHPRLWH